MALLELEHVSKRFVRGQRREREHVALRDVSFEMEEGEIVAVWGRPRSGRTTLLHVAGGVVAPSEGVVRFAGRSLQEEQALGARGGISLASMSFRRVIADSVLEHVASPLMGRGFSALAAQSRAYEALRRVDAIACAGLDADDLDHGETARVSIARALVSEPRLLLVDEPTIGVSPARGRDEMLALLRSIARRDRIAVLMTVGDAAALAGVDRAVTIDHGELRGETRPQSGRVLAFRSARGDSSA